jgi:hypothetical protein
MFFLVLAALLSFLGVVEATNLKIQIIRRALELQKPQAVIEDQAITLLMVRYTFCLLGSVGCGLIFVAALSMILTIPPLYTFPLGFGIGYAIPRLSNLLERVSKKRHFTQDEIERYQGISRTNLPRR